MDLWAEFRKEKPFPHVNGTHEYVTVNYFDEHPVLTVCYIATLAAFSLVGNIGNILVSMDVCPKSYYFFA